jgi:hypothetical protein
MACICSGESCIVFFGDVGVAFLSGSNESIPPMLAVATAADAGASTFFSDASVETTLLINPNAELAGDAPARDASAALLSSPEDSLPFNDKLSNMEDACLTSDAAGAVAGAESPPFRNPNADDAATVGAAGAGAATLSDMKSNRLSPAGAGGAAVDGAAAGGAEDGTEATFKPPNKEPPLAGASAGGAGGGCCGGAVAGAAGSGAASSSKSSRFATGAGGGAAGVAVGLGGGAAPATGVATPKEFNTRLAGSRMAGRV